jgi:enamine deaminase RidA (YjgF/YER057c/UK114 family)
VGGDDVVAQTRQIFENMAKILAAGDAGFEDVLRVTVYLTDIADRAKINAEPLAWVTWLGQMFFWLVEVAVPGGLANQVWQHWIHVAYLCEVILIVGGLFIWDTVFTFGAWAMFFTVVAHVLVMVLGDTLRGRHSTRWAMTVILLSLAGVFTFLGVAQTLAAFEKWTLTDEVVKSIAGGGIAVAVICTFAWIMHRSLGSAARPVLRTLVWIAISALVALGALEILRWTGVVTEHPVVQLIGWIKTAWEARPLIPSE